VTEERRRDGMHVTISGSLLPGGFTKVIGHCQKSPLDGVQ
jgi:hypothetical protein